MADASFIRGEHETRLTAAAAVASGEVWQTANGLAAVYTGLNAAASGDRANFTTTGQFTFTKATGVVLLDGAEAYWDHSANAITYKPANDRDFYVGTVVGDAASGDTTAAVNLNVRPSYSIDLARDPFRSVIVKTAGTPELIACGGAARFSFSATAEAQKLDLLSVDGFAVGANAIVDGVFTVTDNGDNAAGDFNIGVANGTNATDADSITESCFIHFDWNQLNLYAESDDGTTEVAATDTTIDLVEGTPVYFTMDLRNPADIQIYINGALVLGSTVFKLDAATGPLKLLAHLEKTSDDTPGEVYIDRLRVRTMEQ